MFSGGFRLATVLAATTLLFVLFPGNKIHAATSLSSVIFTNLNKVDFIVDLSAAPTNMVKVNVTNFFTSNTNYFLAAGTNVVITTTIAGTNVTFTVNSTGVTTIPAVTNYFSAPGSNVSIVTNISGTNVTWTITSSNNTINATDTYLPARLNATTFTNSPIHVLSATNTVLDGQLIFGTNTPPILDRSGANLNLELNTSGLFNFNNTVGSGSPSVSIGNGLINSQRNSIGSANPIGSYGVLINNPFVATAGLQQNSPGMAWAGKGWGTNSSTSQAVEFGAFVTPSPGADTPTGRWALQTVISNAAPVSIFEADSQGPIKLARGITKAQKTAIANPENGMIVYQTDNTPGLRAYVNGAWVLVVTTLDP